MDDIIRLQIIVGHQEEEIANLSKELYTQQQELNKLRQQVTALIERFRSFQDANEGGQDKIPDRRPPHY